MREMLASLLVVISVLGPSGGLGQSGGSDVIYVPCAAHLGTLGATAPRAYEKYFEHPTVPAAASTYAEEKLPNSVATIALAPTSEAEYRTVFGGSSASATPAVRNEIQGVRSSLLESLGRERGDGDFDRDHYKSVVQAKSASFVIVVGHNHEGLLHLLDGSTIFLDDVVSAARPDQRIILISCDSQTRVSDPRSSGGISGEITFPQAFAIAQRISGFISSAVRPLSLVEVQVELASEVRSVELRHKISYFVMKAACVGTAIIVVALLLRTLDPCEDKHSKGCS